jgi:hypothetical protein
MRNEETTCFRCNQPLPVRPGAASWRERSRIALKIAFILSAVITVGSLFTDLLPSFVKCACITFILLLVKSSADQMSQST